jgi:hypothetical protein
MALVYSSFNGTVNEKHYLPMPNQLLLQHDELKKRQIRMVHAT